jgi:hypothetical protein
VLYCDCKYIPKREKGAIFISKVPAMDVKVVKANHDLSEREVQILEVFFQNLCAASNFVVTKLGMALNPLDSGEDTIFHYRLAWQSAITEEQADEFKEMLTRRIQTAVKMSGIEENVEVSVERVTYGKVK